MPIFTPSVTLPFMPAVIVGGGVIGTYGDGRVNPVDVTMALAKGACMRGVKVFEGVAATGVQQARGHVTGVRTVLGDIKTDVVMNCAGMWPGD